MTKGPYKVEHEQLSAPQAAAMRSDLAHQKAPLVGFHVTGYCPGCDHRTVDVFSLLTVVQGDAMIQPPTKFIVTEAPPGVTDEATSATPAPVAAAGLRVAAIHCHCTQKHDGSNGQFGCGSSWLLGLDDARVSPDQDGPPDPRPFVALTEDEAASWWPAAEAVAANTTSAFGIFQSAGTKWQSGVASVLAVAGVATITGGRATLHGINGWSEFFVIALAALALIATASSILMALW